MLNLIEKPLLTNLYDGWASFELEPESTYVHSTSVEERSIHPIKWEESAKDVIFARVSSLENAPDRDFSRCITEINGIVRILQLRSSNELYSFFAEIKSKKVYVDITGIPHHVWAPLLVSAIGAGKSVSVVYVEPRSYTFSSSPTEAKIFDLSETIHGILPLPGFGVLSEPEDEELVLFVPLPWL